MEEGIHQQAHVNILCIRPVGDADAFVVVRGRNYVSFAVTGNKFRRFIREIAGPPCTAGTIIHEGLWYRAWLRTRSTSSRGYEDTLCQAQKAAKTITLARCLVKPRTMREFL